MNHYGQVNTICALISGIAGGFFAGTKHPGLSAVNFVAMVINIGIYFYILGALR